MKRVTTINRHNSRNSADTRSRISYAPAPQALQIIAIVTMTLLPWVIIGQSSPLPDAPKVRHTDRLPYYTTGFL